MSYPTITIGVTAYNAQDTILDALKSAANQSVEVAQIIVVDDCSSDNTLKIVQQSNIHPHLEIYQNTTNQGVAVSRNKIIEHAKGEFIAFFDDDDVSLPQRVEAQLSRVLAYEQEFANSAPVICHTARKQIYPNGEERIEPTMGMREGVPAPSGPKVARRALMGESLSDGYGSTATCSQTGRTSVYHLLNGFDEAFLRCEDSDFAIRLALAGGHFVGVSEPLVTQKMTPTSDKSLEQLRFFNLLLLEKHQEFFDNDSLYKFCREWLDAKYDWIGKHRMAFGARLVMLGIKHPLLTAYRLRMAIPSLQSNRVFSRFYYEQGK